MPNVDAAEPSDLSLPLQYERLVQTLVFEPVGVTTATCAPSDDAYALSYIYPGDAPGKDWGEQYGRCATGGWYLSPVDLAKVLASVAAKDGRILKESEEYSSLDDIRTRGLGLDRKTPEMIEKAGVLGDDPGVLATSAMILFPADQAPFAAVLFTNSTTAEGRIAHPRPYLERAFAQTGEGDTMKLKFIAAAILLSGCSPEADRVSPDASSAMAQTIYLVRHAEKQGGNDPSLTPDGVRRAETLADLLSGVGLTQIHSTNYKRTLETAAPIATRTGIEVVLYDPRDLDAFAEQLASTRGIHLVVGHSNTTPQLAAALGGTAGDEIDEASEYDRLYVLSFNASGVSSEIQRFGAKYKVEEEALTSE